MKDIIEGFRTVVQDLLVPELRGIKGEIKNLNDKIDFLDKKTDFIIQEMDKRFEKVYADILDLKIGQREILTKLDVDKRVTRVEALLEQFLKKAA